jgi:carbon monoxide dehydrogenase subunit G
MTRVETDIEIAAPRERVWETIMDPRRFGDWVSIHRELHKADDGPPREGMRVEQTLCIRGARFKVKWQLTECDGETHAVWEGKGPMGSDARTVYKLAGEDGRTRFRYVNEFRAPGGPLGAVASKVLVGGVPEREANRSLQTLKALLEG